MATIREVKKELRHREWAEEIAECQSSGMKIRNWCQMKGISAERASGMLKDLSVDHIYIVCGHTDMRKSIDGLAAIIQQQYQLDLFSNSAFLFCGRRRNRMKVLLWEDDGFLLLYKRLENGKFNWPRNEQEVRDLTYEQYVWLLQGLSVDQSKAIKKMPDGIDIC